MADDIRPGERRELKSLVRTRMKVLRSEVEERHSSQLAEIGARTAQKFQGDNARIKELNDVLDQLATEMNQRYRAIIAEYADVAETSYRYSFHTPSFSRKDNGKSQFQRALTSAVHAQRQKALLDVDRLESELITKLAIDALKTEAAHAFVRSIPDIEALMPADSLDKVAINPGEETS
jgi:hypothetical protein